MVWNKDGVIKVTNGNANVIGTTTQFTLGVKVGDVILIGAFGAAQIYEIATITDDTHLALSVPYAGATVASIPYAIFPTQERAKEALDQLSRVLTAINATATALTVVGGNVGIGGVPTSKLSVTGNANVTGTLAVTGSSTVGGSLTLNATGTQLFVKNGATNTPTVIQRADGQDYLFLLSDPSTSVNAVINGLRPLSFNLSTGELKSSNGQSFAGGAAFSGETTYAGVVTLSSGSPTIRLFETDQAVDEKQWRWNVATKQVNFQSVNDAGTVARNAYVIARGTGTDIDSHTFYTGAGAVRLKIDATGNIGIGTTSPSGQLDVSSTLPSIYLTETDAFANGKKWRIAANGGIFSISGSLDTAASSEAAYIIVRETGPSIVRHSWYTSGATEQMRLGPTGILNVFGGQIEASNLLLQGVGIDAYIRTQNSTSRLYLGSSGANRWSIGDQNLLPSLDNTYGIGNASQRLTSVWAVTGAIQTSDETQKTFDDDGFSSAELSAAKEITQSIKKYQWNDSIAEKGSDDARVHIGIGAQTVWGIMAAHGLIDEIGETPSCKYAFLCYDTWEAEDTKGPDGNVESSREAGSRFAVRYDQLAMFLIAAQEQRLAALEGA